MTDLYKHDNGNLSYRLATTPDEEERARADGFIELEELFPTEAPKGRKKKA